jgi:hypothetical protein
MTALPVAILAQALSLRLVLCARPDGQHRSL